MAWDTQVRSQDKSYQKFKKMVLDTFLLNTQHYEWKIKNKDEQYIYIYMKESDSWENLIAALFEF